MTDVRPSVLAFLEGGGPDARGRTVFEVLGFDNAALERTHDYIQWLFPLNEPSGAVPDAPVLKADEIEAIQASATAQMVLAAATDRMTIFFGQTRHWLAPADHNHLRITRIIRSLRLLRGDGPANAFRDDVLACVKAMQAPVSARSRGYWMTA
jgi:Opioid growth factor receptor (OGFr) conserved region